MSQEEEEEEEEKKNSTLPKTMPQAAGKKLKKFHMAPSYQ